MVNPVQGGQPQPQVSGVSSGVNLNLTSTSNDEQLLLDTLSSLSASSTAPIVISSSSNPQLSQPSLFSIMQAVSLASVLNKQSAYLNSATVNSVSSKFYRDMIFNAQNLLALLTEATQLQADQSELVDSINAQNQQENQIIDAYNEGVPDDTSETQQMNQAATDYNNAYNLYNQGLITADEFSQAQTDYNNAVSNYNNYVLQRNGDIAAFNNSIASYNAQVDINNAELAVINSERMALGLEALPLEPYLTASPGTVLTLAQTAPPSPVSVLSVVTNPTASTIPPYVAPDDIISGAVIPVLTENAILTGQTKKGLNLTRKMRTFIDFFLHTKTTVYGLPPAFASLQAASGTSNVGSGSDTGLAAISSSLDPVIVSQLLNKGARNADYVQYSNVIKPNTFDAALAATANVLAGASTINALQLLQSLKDGISLGGSEEDLKIALTLGLASNVLDLVSKNILSQGLQETGVAGSAALNSQTNLSLAGFATSVLSNTLGLPGLGGQLLGLAGLNSSDVFNLTSQGTGFSSLISNPFTQQFVADQLSTQVANSVGVAQGLSGEALTQFAQNINQALSQAAFQTSTGSSNEFFNNFSTALGNAGISGPLAQNVLSSTFTNFFQPAFNSSADFRNSLQQSLINQGFSSGDALQIATSISNTSPQMVSGLPISVGDINANLFAGNLAYNLQQAGITTPSEIAAKVASNLLANTEEIAEATFRDGIRHELEVEGLKKELATRIAAGTVIPLSVQNNPLLSQTTTQFLSQQDLHQKLVGSIKGVYSSLVSPEQAELEAKILADKLVGPANANAKDIHDAGNALSLVNTLRNEFSKLKTQNDQTAFNNAMDKFKDYLKPSVEVYDFSQRLIAPGTRILYVNDLMTAPPPTTGPVKIGGTNPPLEIPA